MEKRLTLLNGHGGNYSIFPMLEYLFNLHQLGTDSTFTHEEKPMTLTFILTTESTRHDRRCKDAESVRRLMEYLGEKIGHDWYALPPFTMKCKKCGWICDNDLINEADSCVDRTFSCPDDQQAVLDRMVELKDWDEFDHYAYKYWNSARPLKPYHTDTHAGNFIAWLFSHNREGYNFLNLAAEFLKGKDKNEKS